MTHAPPLAIGAGVGDVPQPLELEHAIGYHGRYLRTAVLHPTAVPAKAIYAVGKLVVATNTEDPHDQLVLKGHDAVVTALDVSASGRYLASGQATSLKTKEGHGHIIIWDVERGVMVQHLHGHLGGVISLAFSPDDRWLASTGEDGKTFIWDVSSGHLASGIRETLNNEKAHGIVWGDIREAGTRRQAYEFYVGYNTGIRACTWAFDIKTMQYRLAHEQFQVPGSGGRIGGFTRMYHAVALSGRNLLCGTASSDVVVFNVDTKLYKTSFVVGGGGVEAVASITRDGSVLVGTGDGKLTQLMGDDKNWRVVREIQLKGGITSIHPSADGAEVLIGSNAGVLYRTMTHDLTTSLYQEAHTAAVTDVAVPRDRSDIFATASADGSVRVWSLSDYTCTAEITLNVGGGIVPTRIYFSCTPGELVVGCSDGTIKGFSVGQGQQQPQGGPAKPLWSTQAHRGPVTALGGTDKYIMTGGEDGVAKVWTLAWRECVAVLSQHTKQVTAVLPDNTSPSIVHTTSMDKTINTYDLAQVEKSAAVGGQKNPRRLVSKNCTECTGFTSIAQRATGEHEIVAVTADGGIKFYDIDYADPVLAMADHNQVRANAVSVHPQSTGFAVAHADGGLSVFSMAPDQPKASNVAYACCHSGGCGRAVWCADGKQLVSVGSDGDVCVWNYFLP